MKNTIIIFAYINRFLMVVTFILYITIILGVCMQIALGGFHILSSIILIFRWKNLNSSEKNNLKKYFSMVVFYLCLWLVESHFMLLTNSGSLIVFGLIIVPMSLAGYYTYILENLMKRML